MDILSVIFFYIFSFLSIVGSIIALNSKSFLNTIMWASCVFVTVGGFYILLNATFNATLQIGVWGILIPIFLAISTSYLDKPEQNKTKFNIKFATPAISIAFLLIFILLGITSNYFERLFEVITGDLGLNLEYSSLAILSENLTLNYGFLIVLFLIVVFLLIVGLNLISVFKDREE